MRRWVLLLLSGVALAALGGCGHNPNHGISRTQALAAARRTRPALPRIPKGFKGTRWFTGPHGEHYFVSRGPRPAGGPAVPRGGQVMEH